ncbi:slit homolog 1 protein-like [Mytilus trossulus]|uniref:slit homolog 1 protein-like n=1 Tax=Mytilus trossulus TaxID=6551 RepID=UPI003005D7EF
MKKVCQDGANYDEACTSDVDCTGTNAAKCAGRKCTCSDGYFRKTTATECAAKVALDATCIVTDSAKDQCSVVNTECRTDGSESKCLCKATHYSDGNACQTSKKPEETCAAKQCVTHATCNTKSNPNKCQCNAGYTATPATTPTMCSGVMKVATLWYMLAVPIYVSMMSLIR